jgi:hypothetical protein
MVFTRQVIAPVCPTDCFSLQCCPSKSLSFARISYATAQGRQNHGGTESCRERDRRGSPQ